MNKKGLSTVVVTVIMVLLVIVAIGIIWGAIKPTIKKGASSAGTSAECLQLNLEIASASYKNLTNATTISIKRNAGVASLSAIKVLVNGELAKTISDNLPEELATKPYTVLDSRTSPPTKVEIAGVIGETTCSVADSTETIAFVL